MSGHADLPTPAAPTAGASHDPADVYGAHAVGIPSTVLAPIRHDLPSGRRRANVLTLALRAVRGTS